MSFYDEIIKTTSEADLKNWNVDFNRIILELENLKSDIVAAASNGNNYLTRHFLSVSQDLTFLTRIKYYIRDIIGDGFTIEVRPSYVFYVGVEISISWRKI